MQKQLKEQLDKLKREKLFLVILSLFFVAVLLWVGLSIFISQQRVLVEADLISLSQPLVPSLNRELLEELATRKYFTDNQLESFSIYVWKSIDETEELKIIDIVNGQIVQVDESLENEVVPDINERLRTPSSPVPTPAVIVPTPPVATAAAQPETNLSPVEVMPTIGTNNEAIINE